MAPYRELSRRMNTKIVRLALAGGLAVGGLVIAGAAAKPPHQVTVAVLRDPLPANTPVTTSVIASESVPASWAQQEHLLTPSQAVGFESRTPLPAGVPLPAGNRAGFHLPPGIVALPVTLQEGAATGVVAGGRVAVYRTSVGSASAGELLGARVPVLEVLAPPGTPNPQTDEVVVLAVPVGVGASLVGQTLVLAPMTTRAPAIWYTGGTGTMASTPSSPSSNGTPSSSTHSSHASTTKKS
ncbi:SAF domain-containing protein [Sulfobacillus thermosulfidooxidans]|uniref:SAF domain-containing protein n=1 Tax=Sulfobacillus thermosulfidooxidans TaxID=28034 RepID=UPI0006B48A76|nr:SAF domain-containing protein [Sulfobacillus thermosulfidooxidans]